jgi:multidrug efflux pump subunit AcrA (membrane-fusion protein)
MDQEQGMGPSRREWLLAALGLLAGCGGVDSGGTGTGSDSTLAVGSITGFGSIIVNGVRYDDALAAISDDDGVVRTNAELRLGMNAEVIASAVSVVDGVATASASSIRVRSMIEGPIESIDLATGQLVAIGQNVLVVDSTVFDLGEAVPLAVGNLIEVHATLDVARLRYVATRIERRAALARYKLRGAVNELDLVGRTLRMGALRIDWSGVSPAEPASTLAPGRMLQIMLAPTPATGTRTALSIRADMLPLADRDRVELEGRVTAFTSITEFQVDGVSVDARGARFDGGAAGLVQGAKVEVKGSLRSGVLLAIEVEVEDDAGGDQSFELHGSIESVDAAAMRFVVRGVTVGWNADTRFDSSSPADLVVGRRVEVRGRLSSDGQAVDATLIHVER